MSRNVNEFETADSDNEPDIDDLGDADETNKHQHIKTGVIEIPDDVNDHGEAPRFSFRKLWAFTGPGFLMSIAYVDPGNLESDLQAGAQGGYTLLWVLLWATVFGLFLQILSARLGVVTGHNLAQVCRHEYPPALKYTLWIMMEIAIIASDIQEVIGSAIAISILSSGKIKLWQGALITGVDSFTFLLLEQYGLRKLEAFFAALITVMCGTFGYMYVVSSPNQLDVMKGVAIPDLPSSDLEQAIGIIGAVIMPHNLYLHSALVLSRKVNTRDKTKVREANLYYAVECSIALLVSFIINLFIVSVFAEGFFNNSKIDSSNISLLTAGDELALQFSTAIKYIWAVGLLAAGQSSTMTGTYAGQFVMEGFLRLKIRPWKRVMLTRSFAMIPTVLVAAFATSSVLAGMNEWLNVLQSIQLPFALVPVLHFTSSPRLMGRFVNGWAMKLAGWTLALLIMMTNIWLIIQTIEGIPQEWYYYFVVSLLGNAYLALVGYIMIGPFLKFTALHRIYGGHSAPTGAAATAAAEAKPLLVNSRR